MQFNSLIFALFLPIVWLLYWFVFDRAIARSKYQLLLQNLFILLASYIFYGWWDWKCLFLIALTTFCSYLSGLFISACQTLSAHATSTANTANGASATDNSNAKTNASSGCALHTCGDNSSSLVASTQSLSSTLHTILAKLPSYLSFLRSARFYLWANIVLNLAILAAFKYYNFFLTSFGQAFSVDITSHLLHWVLPVGISFYTFQALSYSIDVYRKQISATTDFPAFAAFLSFFPQLVAGPIERATNLLPQFLSRRSFDYAQATDGIRQMLWGLFKKVVIADNCASYVNDVFGNLDSYNASTLALAAVLFTFQIYGDFSGYSDIAIGTAKLFGIRLMRNFRVPYFSRDIAEFWRRWHISLTTWFRDYVYIPLGGSRPHIPQNCSHPQARTKLIVLRNTFVIFLLSGLWHGANWTFILWGLFHALLFLPLILRGKNRKHMDEASFKDLPRIVLTFALVTFGWILFRAESIDQFFLFIEGLCHKHLFSVPWLKTRLFYIPLFLFLGIMLLCEWFTRDKEHPLQDLERIPLFRPAWACSLFYAFFFILCLCYCGSNETFIYFQF